MGTVGNGDKMLVPAQTAILSELIIMSDAVSTFYASNAI